MNLFGVLFILMVLAAGLASGALGVLSRRKRAGAPGAAAFSITMLTLSVLCFGYVGSLLVSDLPVNLLLLKLRYIGLHILPVAWLCFALSYTDRQIRRRYILALLVIPVLTILIAWTNEWHGWLWQETAIRQDGSGLWEVYTQRGPWFRIANWYGYILLFAATAILLRAFLKQGHVVYKGQTMALLFGVLFPWFGNVLFVAGFTTLDWLPVTFTIGAMSLFWGMRRYKLLDLAPVARDTVFQSMESGVIVLDMRGRVVDVNPAAWRLLGLTPEEIIGLRPEQFCTSAWNMLCKYDLFADQGDQELAIEETDQFFDVRITSLHHREHLAGYLIILHDITARKRVEQELDAFAHTVAHDLKNPLGVTMSMSKLILKTVPVGSVMDDDVRKLFDAIARNAERMQRIIDELLMLASLNAEIETEAIDMADIVWNAVDRLCLVIDQYEAEVVEPDEWPVALGHGPWIEEVWSNYISNALKYGGRPPRVELGATLLDNGMIRFWIRDNGAGLTPEEQAQLFKKFSRVKSKRELAKGHGLGLSIVVRIVEKLGGEIGVTSEVGRGSTFSFTLPAAPHDEEVLSNDTFFASTV